MPRPKCAAGSEPGDGAVVRGEEAPRAVQERRPLRRKAHQSRRPLDQSMPDPILQPLQLDADRALRGPKRLGRARKTVKVGDHDKGPDGIDIQREHGSIRLCCL